MNYFELSYIEAFILTCGLVAYLIQEKRARR